MSKNDLPLAEELLNTTETPKILKRSWLREGIEDMVLELGGPKEFCNLVWQREPKEFIKLVGKLLPHQLEVPADTNLIVLDGGFRLINKEMMGPRQELPAAIDAEFDVLDEKIVKEDTDARD